LSVSHPKYACKVSFQETRDDGSKARRYAYFPTKKAAQALAAKKRVELGNHGTRHGDVAEDERGALIAYRTWASRREDAPSLSALLAKAIEAHETARPPLTVSEAVAARTEAAEKRGLSRAHTDDLRQRLERFAESFGKCQIADLSAVEIEQWLHRLGVGPQTWRNYAKVIGSVFSMAVKQGYLQVSPMAGVSSPKVVRPAPSILTPRQLLALLTAASDDLRPLLVLQAFAGLRRAEANRLAWRHLHLDAPSPYAELPSVVTKTSRRRVCDLPSCAVAWLRPLLERPEVPLGLSVAVYRARLREAAEVAEVAWEENLLPHSFGTYHVVHHRNASLTAEIMGNSPGIVRAHYANTAAPEAAAAWWAVLPADPSATKLLPFVATSRRAG